MCFAVGVVQIGFIDCLEEQVDFLWGFGAIGIEDAQDKALNDVFEVALHRGAFFEEGAFNIVVHLVFYDVFIDRNWLVVDRFSILKGVKPADAGCIPGLPGFLEDALMHPEGHLLLEHIMRDLQFVAQLF